jgi:hypothetical protein
MGGKRTAVTKEWDASRPNNYTLVVYHHASMRQLRTEGELSKPDSSSSGRRNNGEALFCLLARLFKAIEQ